MSFLEWKSFLPLKDTPSSYHFGLAGSFLSLSGSYLTPMFTRNETQCELQTHYFTWCKLPYVHSGETSSSWITQWNLMPHLKVLSSGIPKQSHPSNRRTKEIFPMFTRERLCYPSWHHKYIGVTYVAMKRDTCSFFLRPVTPRHIPLLSLASKLKKPTSHPARSSRGHLSSSELSFWQVKLAV